ncbi:MAG: acetyl-CoA carboxylase biotin carboxyl carrier protein [Fimbriimonadaceae bacterium]
MLPSRLADSPNGVIMGVVPDHRKTIDELAGLIDEFKLDEATLQVGDFKIAFAKRRKGSPASRMPHEFEDPGAETIEAPVAAVELTGTPVNSPMAGIFYGSSSPGSTPFVRPGVVVEAGQVIGLIEAMKVFNEITSPVAGVVERIVVESGAVVQPGDPLLYLS